jgi:histidine triad (HIT) family protein
MMTADCPFCTIVRNKTARIVLETDDLLCFFPLRPNLLGHTLISPKTHFVDIRDCPPAFGTSVFVACQLLHQQYNGAIGSTGFNLLNANGRVSGQSVDHLHFHFMPRIAGDGLDTWPLLPAFEAEDLDGLLTKLRIHGDQD